MLCVRCKKEIPGSPFCPWCGTEQNPAPKKKNVKKRGNGQGTVYRRGRTWTAETCSVINGERIRAKKGGFKTKTDGLQYLAKMNGEIPQRLTVKELYDTWSDTHYNDISINKMYAYMRAWDRIKTIWTRDILSLRFADLQKLIDPVGGYYAKRDIKTVLSGVWSSAMKDNPAINNLPQMLSLGKPPDADKRAFSKSQVETMWDRRLDIPFLNYPLIMIYTGMAPGELRNLKPENIDFDENVIRDVGTKNEGRRILPILFPKIIRPILENYDSFAWRKDKVWFYDEYKTALKKAGIGYLPPNCCRHTTATLLAKNKVPFASIQKIMRHTSYKTTLGYTHMELQDEFDALETL